MPCLVSQDYWGGPSFQYICRSSPPWQSPQPAIHLHPQQPGSNARTAARPQRPTRRDNKRWQKCLPGPMVRLMEIIKQHFGKNLSGIWPKYCPKLVPNIAANLSKTCSKHIQDMSQTCPNMSETCPKHVQNTSQTCPKHPKITPDMSRTCPKLTPGMSKIHPQHVQNTSTKTCKIHSKSIPSLSKLL